MDAAGAGRARCGSRTSRWHLVVPAVAIALPLAAMIERVQSQAMAVALAEPFALAALGARRAAAPPRVA